MQAGTVLGFTGQSCSSYNVGAATVGKGFGGIVYNTYDKETVKTLF